MARKYHRERLNRDSKSWRKCYGPIDDDDSGGDSVDGDRRGEAREERRIFSSNVGLAREAGRQRRRPFSLRRRPVAAIASAADRPKCHRAVAAPSSERTRGETTTTDSRTKERRAPSATSPCVVGGAALVCCRSAAGFPADTKPGPIATQGTRAGLCTYVP